MPSLPWIYQIEVGARSATFQPRAILNAMGRLTRYYDYDFPQTTRNLYMRFVLTNGRSRSNSRAAMWTSGRTAYFAAWYPWINPAQIDAAVLHEMGHIFGSDGHAPPGNVMAAILGDPHINFTQTDHDYWFSKAGGRFKPNTVANPVGRPWEPREINHWYPVRAMESMYVPCDSVHFGCNEKAPRWEFINKLFRKTVEVK